MTGIDAYTWMSKRLPSAETGSWSSTLGTGRNMRLEGQETMQSEGKEKRRLTPLCNVSPISLCYFSHM